MNVRQWIACAVLWLATIGPILAWQRRVLMEILLQRRVWRNTRLNYADVEITDFYRQSITVEELFAISTDDGWIVNQNNVNDKVRQYYNLLTVAFSEAVHSHMSYFRALIHIYQMNRSILRWSLENHLVALISHYDPIYSRMDGALSLISGWYRGEEPEEGDEEAGDGNGGEEPRLDRQFQSDLQYLRSVTTETDDLLERLGAIWTRAALYADRNLGITPPRIVDNDIRDRNRFINILVRLNCSERRRIEKSKEFLADVETLFLQCFAGIGFQYDPDTDETTLNTQ